MALLEDFPFEPGFRLQDGDLLNKVAAEPAYSVDNTVTATGSTAPTAYNLRATTTIITGGADNTGVRLPPPQVGRILFIWNYTASGKRVYPHDTETINGAASAGIPFSGGMVVICTGGGTWAATQASTSATGDIVLDASDADTAVGTGHSVSITGGQGGATSGSGGGISLTAGAAIAGPPGDGGSISITAGASKAGTAGTVTIVSPGGPVGLSSGLVTGTGVNSTFTVTPGSTADLPTTMAVSGKGGLQFNSIVGFNSTAPVAKPDITGSRGANAALASLITALAAIGLVTDKSS